MDRKDIQEIIESWMLDNGRKIDKRVNPLAYEELVKTLIGKGATKDDLDSQGFRSMVVAEATHDKVHDPKSWKKMVDADVRYAVRFFFRDEIVKLTEEEIQARVQYDEDRETKIKDAEEKKRADKIEAIKNGEAAAPSPAQKSKGGTPIDSDYFDSMPKIDTSIFKDLELPKIDPEDMMAEFGIPKYDK